MTNKVALAKKNRPKSGSIQFAIQLGWLRQGNTVNQEKRVLRTKASLRQHQRTIPTEEKATKQERSCKERIQRYSKENQSLLSGRFQVMGRRDGTSRQGSQCEKDLQTGQLHY